LASRAGLLPRRLAIPLMACLICCWFMCGGGLVVVAGDTVSLRLFNFTFVYSPLSPIEGLLVKGLSGAP
jgi:hypothetical protein